MNRTFLAAAVVLLGAWGAYTQTPRPPRPANIQNIRENLYLVTGEGGNVAAYVTSEGVVLVDDMFERNADDILGVVRSVTDKPVRYVLNTHQHSDHAGGNARIPPVVEIIAHQNARANMAALKQPGLPRVTFSQETAVFLGGKEVLAAYYGRGHTGGDAVVYFPDLKVIHTGDLFLSGPVIPRRQGGANIYIDYAQGGSAVEWTDALGRILTLDFDTVIPGHGPLASRADVVTFRADFAAMRGRVADLLRQGKSKGDVSRMLIDDYGWPAGGLAIQQVDALIAEIRGLAR